MLYIYVLKFIAGKEELFFSLILIYYFNVQDGGAEFVFAEDLQKRRGWGERMFSSIGTSYMMG